VTGGGRRAPVRSTRHPNALGRSWWWRSWTWEGFKELALSVGFGIGWLSLWVIGFFALAELGSLVFTGHFEPPF
jgi:hypothetical protein